MLVTGLTHYHGIDSSFYWGFFAFSGTFVTYNFHRLVRHKSFETAQISTLWVLATAGVIVAGYALPVPFLGKSFRDISGLKGLWITIVWVLLLYFPLWQYDYEIHYADLAIIGLFTFVQFIPFDIRDLSYDSASMKTLPQLVGIRGARIIGTLLIILLIYIVLLLHPFHYLLAVVVLFALIGLWWKQTPQRLPLLEFIWDGTLIVLGLYYYAIRSEERRVGEEGRS